MPSSSLLLLPVVFAFLHHGVPCANAFVVGGDRALVPGGNHLRSVPTIHPGISRPCSCLLLHAQRNNRAADAASSNPVDNSPNKKDNNKRGWRRRVMSRLRRKRGSLESTATAEETTTTTTNAASVDRFLLESFEKLSPEQLFSTLEKTQYTTDVMHGPFFEDPVELQVEANSSVLPIADQQQVDVLVQEEDDEEELLLDCALPISLIGATSSFEGGPPLRKVVRNWFQGLLTNCFCEWAAEEPKNLNVRCSPTGNVLGQLLRGQLHCNARAEFDRLVFDFLRLSGGCVEGSRLALNLLAFTVDRSKELVGDDSSSVEQNNPTLTSKLPAATSKKGGGLLDSKKKDPRYQAQFDLHAHDCVFTEEDLFESSCVRIGLQNLLRRILKNQAGVRTKSVVVQDISITTGKIAIKGQANVEGVRVAFEVRSGIDFTHRGHVVTFPGLELSLMSGFFVPISGVELDIGHNARLRECVLDGDKKQAKVSASVTITPTHTLKLSEQYIQSSKSYSSRFSCDVGKFLTRKGRFSL